ncbi:putative dehydrogenase [Virgibacillus natechei]|uniref:Dehydrogenase n=1 Tax=Virgibacillus natechei TaxID=1216297 RepID=A0ABS4IE68_9BACI|nr:Gfo/Idh/MocA family oxidoreductase [Virgibacillus natechei]MBP1969244.1 putative dehydrogenase [Virgibacillus natechei]UZD12405.1 Gfo/Idh/MocA family oxidoreductase [Virgibacillus natechei]
MTKKVSILLVGMSGYGNVYLNELLTKKNRSASLVGVVDINPKRSDYYEEIINRDIPIYESMNEFYRTNKSDLAIISTPIHLHMEQSCYAMNHGSNVLCEKPMSANPEDVQSMIDTRDKTGKFLAVGFNWSFTPSVQQLKKDILSGEFGKVKRLKSIALWPRSLDYFNRSNWAGKKYSSTGDMIFDSVANNATAHFLHHLLYVTGNTVDTSAQIKNVTAELYRTNAIETFDTSAVKVQTTSNIDIYYYATHAVKETREPQFVIECENAVIHYESGYEDSTIIAYWKDGTKKVYGDPENEHLAKLDVCIHAIQQDNQQILCGSEAASAHVNCIYAMHQSVPEAPYFPKHLTNYENNQKLYWIDGLADTLLTCFENWRLPSDQNVEWSKKGKTIEFN